MDKEDGCLDCIKYRLIVAKLQFENNELERKLLKALGTCPLTGLLSKSRMMKEIDRNFLFYERSSHKNSNDQNHFSIIFIDVDNFKKLNDSDHSFGDKLLIEFGQYLRLSTRNIDLVARFGGDEFFILAPTTNKGQAEQLSLKIQSGLAHYIFAGAMRPTCLQASFGIASTSEGFTTPHALISKSDERMYRQKTIKKNIKG